MQVRQLALALLFVVAPLPARAQSAPRWDPGLVLARSVAAGPLRVRAFFPSARTDGVGVALRFDAAPRAIDLARLERAGARLPRSDRSGRVLTAGRLVGAFVPWDALDDVARVPGLRRIALGRAPGERAQMDVSVREVGAHRAWTRRDGSGLPLTGRGVIAADMDTAVDLHHPMFFFADGGQFPWIDVDGDGRFTDGLDAADLDADGSADPEEVLRLQDGRRVGTGQRADGRLQAGEDWLWVDADGNGRRDYGLEGGYGEDDPCFGELLLVVDDADLDDTLDLGETLTALGTSKNRRDLRVPRAHLPARRQPPRGRPVRRRSRHRRHERAGRRVGAPRPALRRHRPRRGAARRDPRRRRLGGHRDRALGGGPRRRRGPVRVRFDRRSASSTAATRTTSSSTSSRARASPR